MDFDTPGAFALFLSLGAVAGGLIRLAAYRMKLKAETERARLEGSSLDSTEELRDEVRHTLTRQAAEIDELHERLDFAERLLTQGKPVEAAPDTPPR